MRSPGEWVEVALPSSPHFRRKGRLLRRGQKISVVTGSQFIWYVRLDKTEVDPVETITMNEFWLHRLIKFVFYRS